MTTLGAISTTVVRIVIPVLAAIGGGIGGMIGAFRAFALLAPERASLIVGYQSQIINDLEGENRRQAQLIADLELRVQRLEDIPPRHLS